MKKIITMICAACTLVFTSAGTAMADSGNFAGPYIGISGLAAGAAVEGKSRSATEGVFEEDTVNAGKATLATGIEAGYALPLGDQFLIDIGASYLTGEAKIGHVSSDVSGRGGEDGSPDEVSFAVDKIASIYVAPSVALSDTSSVYLKWGLSEADVGVTGDITTPGNLSGETLALGTRIVLDSGIFIRSEAGYTSYNEIASQGKGNTINATTSYSAEPTIAYGKVSLGFRF